MIRLAGKRAHPFFWVSDEYLKFDKELEKIPSFYEGIKLHGGETPWLQSPGLLKRVLSIARERKFCVQIHTGRQNEKSGDSISGYLPYCRLFPEIHFDLAHGYPKKEVCQACRECRNVWFDLAFTEPGTYEYLRNQNVPEDRLMFGSDIPAPQRFFGKCSLTDHLRKQISRCSSLQYSALNMTD